MVVTFWPHPQNESNIYSLSQRLSLLERYGIDLCLILEFNSHLRNMPAENFIKQILFKKINPAAIIIGRNFTFGKNTQGDCSMLNQLCSKKGIKLVVVPLTFYKERLISSNYIRFLIRQARFEEVEKLLGRKFCVCGRVIQGSRRGRLLGFPTANIYSEQEILPGDGVYGVSIALERKRYSGICYIGKKPTFSQHTGVSDKESQDRTIEVHIFNFKRSLYGDNVKIQFIKKLRKERKFTSTQNLANQIKKDILRLGSS